MNSFLEFPQFLSRLEKERVWFETYYGRPPVVVLTSGGYSPPHRGHVANISASAEFGDYLIVLLNSDRWLREKTGCVFLPLPDRLAIISNLKGVDFAAVYDDGSRTVATAIRAIAPDIFTKGGDRTPDNLAECEVEACRDLACEIRCGVGGGKVQSSSELINRILTEATPRVS